MIKKIFSWLVRIFDVPWVSRRSRLMDGLSEEAQREIDNLTSRGDM